MSDKQPLLLCYNRGCAKKFDPDNNLEDSCVYHPGNPFFHDAYKGWSCCKKKCTDFTEFLNIKGCTMSWHNPTKPKEPEKYVPDKNTKDEVIEYHASKPVSLPRPSADLPLTRMKPKTVSQVLVGSYRVPSANGSSGSTSGLTDVPIGTMCKNNGCKEAYGKASMFCNHHPGVPVFHEGMKYWSCCKKKTSEFNAFLEQAGCAEGAHCWIKEIKGKTNCRVDWHQTALWVVISIYAKKYDPDISFVKLSSVKLLFEVFFPAENSVFSKTMELYGIIETQFSSMSMLPSKIEIRLKKAEALSWGQLEYPKSKLVDSTDQLTNSNPDEEHQSSKSGVESVDLADL